MPNRLILKRAINGAKPAPSESDYSPFVCVCESVCVYSAPPGGATLAFSVT